jgi:hypothetical protein
MLGGMNYCYHKIKKKNPKAQILLFTTLPIFNKGRAGYDSLYNEGIGLRHYVDAQIEWCKNHDIPYLDLFRQSGFNLSNHGLYYQTDEIHPNIEGYKQLRAITLQFLAFPTGKIRELNEFEQKIRSLGYSGIKTHDWSNDSIIELPQPQIAYINLHSKYDIPYTDTSNFKDSIEYYDGDGNYLMKRVLVNSQGAISTSFPKRNIKMEFMDDEWIGEVTPKIDFDGWVHQDKYHLKSFYTDWLRGASIVGYQLYDQIEHTLTEETNRIWKRAGVEGHKNARCYPDGFPCMMYLNGEFYGIYIWQLTKHRRNMAQKKHNENHIHVEGHLDDKNFWNGNISWQNVEVRNPKDLYDMEGKAYEEKVELIDENSQLYNSLDSTNISLDIQRTVHAKKAIIQLSRRVGELEDLKENGATKDEIRQFIAQYFDIESMLNYLVFSTVTNNYDGFTKNWQWISYDSEKWYVAPYDLDCTFGNHYEGTLVFPAYYSFVDSDYSFTISRRGIATWFWDYFFDELKKKYADLREADIISKQNISRLIHDWYNRIGDDTYEMEWQQWPNSMCISQTITNPGWTISEDWTDHFYNIPVWNAMTTYYPGDLCRVANRVWIATEATTDVFPYQQLGYTDSLERFDNWVSERIDLEDSFFEYTPEQGIDEIINRKNLKTAAIYSIDGTKIPQMKKGLNIVWYSDGSSSTLFIK